MSPFGLGIVINFIDKASAGMQNVASNFERLSFMADHVTRNVNPAMQAIESLAMSGLGLNVVGEQIMGVGDAIVSTYTKATTALISTGQEMLGFRMQLNALYREKAPKVMEDIIQYAQQSVFEIRSLIPAVTMMKAVGIEAMDEVATSDGKAHQKILDYASDIAAMVPNIRNTYGTGVQGAMGAIKEYVAEGNALTLKRTAGLDILGILGVKKGADMKERSQQVADLVQKLGILGYTANLAGTPMQRLSNLHDVLYKTMIKISDSGVFDSFSKVLGVLSDHIFELSNDEERFNAVTKTIGEAVTIIMQPLKLLAGIVLKLIDGFVYLSQNYPTLAKVLIIFGAISGVALVAVGTILKLAGSFFMLMAGIQMLTQSSAVLKMGFLAMKTSIIGAFAPLLPYLLPIAIAVGLMFLAWKTNFLGFRQVVNDAMVGIERLWNAIKVIFSSLDGKLTRKELSMAQNFGILGVINQIQRLKYHFSKMVEAVSPAWEKIKMVYEAFGKVFALLGGKFQPLINAGIGFLIDFFSGSLNAIVTLLLGITEFIEGIFTSNWDLAWQGVKDIFKGIFDAVTNIFRSAINQLIDILNPFLASLGSIEIPEKVPIVGGLKFDIPQIPRLATGGEILGSGLSFLDPNEIVINSDTTSDLKSFLAENSPRKSGGSRSFTDQSDNSVTFAEGSIVIQVAQATQENIEDLAEELMRKLQRKIELARMATRRRGKEDDENYVLG